MFLVAAIPGQPMHPATILQGGQTFTVVPIPVQPSAALLAREDADGDGTETASADAAGLDTGASAGAGAGASAGASAGAAATFRAQPWCESERGAGERLMPANGTQAIVRRLTDLQAKRRRLRKEIDEVEVQESALLLELGGMSALRSGD